MRNNSSYIFLYPRSLLAADKIDVFDAINLVVYAKLPLKSAGHGKELVAGFIQSDKTESAHWLLSQRLRDEYLDRYGRAIGGLQYPVGPAQYEPLLETMIESGEEVLPYFFHEHHLLVDRQRRAAMFSHYYSELADQTRQGMVTLQLTDSERTSMLVPNAWMTQDSLRTYLDRQGVSPWWNKEINLASHPRLERILMSDAVDAPAVGQEETYDASQLPSYVFGEVLLRRSRAARNFAQRNRVGSDLKAPAPRAANPEDAASTQNERKRPAAPSRAIGTSLPQATDLMAGQDRIEASVGREPAIRAQRVEAAEALASARAPAETAQVAVQSDPPATISDEPMLTRREVAELLGVHPNTIDNWKNKPGFPKSISFGTNVVRWDRGDIRRWKEQQRSK